MIKSREDNMPKIPNEFKVYLTKTLCVRIFQTGMWRCPPNERPYMVYLSGTISLDENTDDIKIHIKLGEFYLRKDTSKDYIYSTTYKNCFYEMDHRESLFETIAYVAIGHNQMRGNPYEEMY